MKTIQVYIIFSVLISLIYSSPNGSRGYKIPILKRWAVAAFTGASMVLSPMTVFPSRAVDEGLQLQLKVLRQQQIEAQKLSTKV